MGTAVNEGRRECGRRGGKRSTAGVWRDGEFVRWGDATVHILAQSLQARGPSRSTTRACTRRAARGGGVPPRRPHRPAPAHLRDHGDWPIAYTRADLIDACAATVRRNPGSKSLKISALIPSIEAELVPQDPPGGACSSVPTMSWPDVIAQHGGTHRWSDALSLKIERDITNRRPDIIPPQAKMAANYTSAMFAKWRAAPGGVRRDRPARQRRIRCGGAHVEHLCGDPRGARHPARRQGAARHHAGVGHRTRAIPWHPVRGSATWRWTTCTRRRRSS